MYIAYVYKSGCISFISDIFFHWLSFKTLFFSYKCPFFSITIGFRSLKFCTLVSDIGLHVFTYNYDDIARNLIFMAIFSVEIRKITHLIFFKYKYLLWQNHIRYLHNFRTISQQICKLYVQKKFHAYSYSNFCAQICSIFYLIFFRINTVKKI